VLSCRPGSIASKRDRGRAKVSAVLQGRVPISAEAPADPVGATHVVAEASRVRASWYAPVAMAASAVLFGIMIVTLRLATAQVSAYEAAFFRSLFGLVFSLPLLAGPGLRLLRTRNFHLYLMRGLFGALAMLTSFWSIAHLPLAQAVSISYSTPLFVTIGAVFALGEVVRLRRWSAVIAGFAGVLLIMRPGAAHFSFAMLVALASAALAAGSYISIKFLSRTEPADAVVIYMNVVIVPLALVPALFAWSWPDASGWLWLVLTGLFGTLGQVFMTRAYGAGDVSALVPLNFIQLPVVVLFAWFLFDQRLDAATAVGAAIIVGANVYIARREALLARRRRNADHAAADLPTGA
jgi:drug/metabolite transporter (DMT)-like permease